MGATWCGRRRVVQLSRTSGWIMGWCLWMLGADPIVVFFCTLFLRLTRWPWLRGLDLVAWLCETCNSAQVCLAIFIPRSLHQRCACRVWFCHTHATCRRVIVPLFRTRHTQCEWQHWVCDAARTFVKYYNYSIWFMRGIWFQWRMTASPNSCLSVSSMCA